MGDQNKRVFRAKTAGRELLVRNLLVAALYGTIHPLSGLLSAAMSAFGPALNQAATDCVTFFPSTVAVNCRERWAGTLAADDASVATNCSILEPGSLGPGPVGWYSLASQRTHSAQSASSAGEKILYIGPSYVVRLSSR